MLVFFMLSIMCVSMIAQDTSFFDNPPYCSELTIGVDEVSPFMQQWTLQVNSFIGLLQALLQKIESGFYVPIKDKEEVLAWIRDTISNLYKFHKKIAIQTNPHILPALFDVTHVAVITVQHIVEKKCSILADLDFSTIEPIKHCCNEQTMLELSMTIEKDLDRLRILIEESGLNVVNKTARLVEHGMSWLNAKTGIYSWYKLFPYIPAVLIFLRQNMLPKSLYTILEHYLYGGNAPIWSANIAAYSAFPQISLKLPSRDGSPPASFRGLGRAERMYYSLIKVLIMYAISIAPITNVFGGKTMIDKVPEAVSQMLWEFWQRLKGVPVKPLLRYDIISNIDLDDPGLIGLEEQKEQLMPVVDYVLNPEQYFSKGISIEKGILLTGPSRTGKTLLAQALAGTVNKELQIRGMHQKMAFIEISYDELKQWKAQEAFANVIEEARIHAPCILFFDELHTYDLQTTGDNSLYNAMLTMMNKLYTSNNLQDQIFIIGATNRPDLIAQELRSPKRFGKEIRFSLPNFQQRKDFFSRKLLHDLAIAEDRLLLDSYARQTVDCSYGQLQSIVDFAKFNSKNLSLCHEHMQHALDTEVHHLLGNIPLTKEERELLVIHQAGHALALYLLEPTDRLEIVTIRPYNKSIKEIFEWQREKSTYNVNAQFQTEYGKIIRFNPHESLRFIKHEDFEKNALVSLAGMAAEKIILGSSTCHYHAHDRLEAFESIQQSLIHGLDNLYNQNALKDIYKTTTNEALMKVRDYEEKIELLLTKYKDQLLILIDYLNKKLTVTIDELDKIFKKS